MKYKKFLSRDPRLREILKYEVFIPKKSRNITQGLVWSIMSQQLSIQVAKVMHGRFIELFGGRFPSPKRILEMPVEKIKAIGISQSKANYIHNVAKFIVENRITQAKLDKMTDEEIIDLLSEIKGVGRWTVEMLLIFVMGREDVFAVDDLGIQKGMIELFKLHDLPKKELRIKMQELSQRWSPYRSYVCLHMWKFSGFKK